MPKTSWIDVAREIGPVFADRAVRLDDSDAFATENYAVLKERKLFSAGVPEELGGGGATYEELAAVLRELARHCGSTALALSMHQHLLAASVWRYRHGQPGQALLEKVAKDELVLVSTGANDWLASNGRMTRVEGGFRVNAPKAFCSGAPAGDLLITSSVYEDPEAGAQVLHFPVPFRSQGVRIVDTWRTHGMRGTGSHDVVLEDVFVADAAISLRRPRGVYHAAFNVIATVAMPLIVSVYVGIAEAAAERARKLARERSGDPVVPYLVGEMENALVTASMAVDSALGFVKNYTHEPTLEMASAALGRKTIATRAAIETVEKAIEIAGGAAYFRSFGLERLLRDVRAGHFHPLPEKRQILFSGRVTLGLDPVAS